MRLRSKGLRDAVNSASVGLDALRLHSAKWLRERLSDSGKSQQAFGQYVTVADVNAPAKPRPTLAKQFGDLAVADQTELKIVAVLGSEGVGKTWLVAQWWLSFPNRP